MLRLKAQILKDYGLSSPPTVTTITSRKKKTKSKFDSQYQQQLKDIWRIDVKFDASGVYECSTTHGYDCRCCTPIIKESVTCPTAKEKQQRKHTPGRPGLRR